MSFSTDIKKVRLDMLMTQQEFAEALGLAYSTINRWENEKGKPTLKAMKAIDAFCKKNNIDFNIKDILANE